MSMDEFRPRSGGRCGRGFGPCVRPAQRANRFSNRAGHEKNCWPVGPGHVVGVVPGPLGRAGRVAGPLGRSMVGSLPIGAGVFGRMPMGADTEVRPPATLSLGPDGRCARWDAQRDGACPVHGWFSAHWDGGLWMNAQRSGHRGPPPRHPVSGPGRTVCLEGRPAETGPTRSKLVLCPSVRGFSDECPWDRTQRSAPPPPCYWLLERRPDRSGVAMSRLPGTHCRTKLLSGSLLTSDDHH